MCLSPSLKPIQYNIEGGVWLGRKLCLVQERRPSAAHCPLLTPLFPVTWAASCSQGWPGQSGWDMPHIAVPREKLG